MSDGDAKEFPGPPPNLYQRIHGVYRDVKALGKSRRNQHFKFDFTPHDDVTDALHDAFVKHGIVQIVDEENIERDPTSGCVRVKLIIAWVNVDNPSEQRVVRAYGEATPPVVGKPDDLGVGKAISYAVKYAQLKTFMLTGDSADLEESAGESREDSKPAAAAPPPDSSTVEQYAAKYAAVETNEQLLEVRKAVGAIVKTLTQEQSKHLGSLDAEASKRVKAQQQQQERPS